MEQTTVARPYARAAFEYALEAGVLAEWADMLSVSAAVGRNETVQQVLGNPALTSSQRAGAFIEICGDSLNQQGQNFIHTLSENGRLPLLPYISEQFELLKTKHEQSVDVNVTAAYPVDSASQDKLAEKLGKRLGRKVNLQFEQDRDLIGGLVIKAGDLVIDGSIRGKLHKLAEAVDA
ncbi:F0F1 ATP synthase subunit delta [Endozoicomonadaceae bacterium StTr2]